MKELRFRCFVFGLQDFEFTSRITQILVYSTKFCVSRYLVLMKERGYDTNA